MSPSEQTPKNILFLMSGSIAAYKACFVVSQLVQLGHVVQVVTTPQALQFIGPATLEGLTGRPALSDTFASQHAMDHIHLSRWADMIVLCPATANTINKMSQGIADDLVTNLFLSHDFSKPFLVAPAMNTAMYKHPTTQFSLLKLAEMGVKVLETGAGTLACGEVGAGRLLEPEQLIKIFAAELKQLPPKDATVVKTEIKKTSLSKILITSGGTQEPIDSMRVLSNLSSGQTGAYLAESLYDQGFEIHYLGATTSVKPQRPCSCFSFTTFKDLDQQLQNLLQNNYYLGVIHAAAVSDFHVSKIISGQKELAPNEGKLPSSEKLIIELAPNFKILPRIKSYGGDNPPKVIGFKFTSTDKPNEREQAVMKLFAEGGVDAVIHNDHADIDKAKGLHSFTYYSSTEKTALPQRLALAERLGDFFRTLFQPNNKDSV